MQVGIVLATVMVGMLATLTPESSYTYEAIIMFLLGAGLGVVMPVMNLAVQNEFEQHDLGVATSSSQLFRSLGSTIGVAIFGAMLTAGLTSHLAGIQDDAYLQRLKQNPAASKISDFNDSNTLLNLNMPDTKSKISSEFQSAVAAQKGIPQSVLDQLIATFNDEQSSYADKVTHAFSTSLQRIFITSSVLMLVATVLVFMLKERRLKAASPDQSPGIE